jgi:peptidoglycan/xylan/chitin deacetylase (PgdA/CDA1 family)
MQNIKKEIDKSALFLIKKLTPIINPLVLNFTDEKNKLLIFYFHGIYESEKQKKLNHVDPQNNLTVGQFTDFIEYFLYHKYHFIKPEDLSEDLTDDRAYIMLTFDDGYFNNTLAIEILNKYKIPATFFITTRNVLENTSYWWDIIYKYRFKKGISLEKIREEQIYLKGFKYPFIESYISQNFGGNTYEPWSDIDRPLNTKELKEIFLNPSVTIGNHTHNHSILTNYTHQEIEEELSISNKILFDITGTAPLALAFPNGNYNNQVFDITRQLGFNLAFTTIEKLNYISEISINNKLICLNRFIAQPTNVKKYGSLNRLGYNPNSLYSSIKESMLFQRKRLE